MISCVFVFAKIVKEFGYKYFIRFDIRCDKRKFFKKRLKLFFGKK